MTGVLAAVLVPLLVFAPSGAASAEQVSVRESTGVVPNVVGTSFSNVGDVIEAAGFVAEIRPAWVDCGPPRVVDQSPVGGTVAPLGSTVVAYITQWPAQGDPCP